MNDYIQQQISAIGALVDALGLCIDTPCGNTGAVFKNSTFELRAYSWGDCANAAEAKECDYCADVATADVEWQEELCKCSTDAVEPVCDDESCNICAPNFVYLGSKFWANWYKHINRGFVYEGEGTPQETLAMFNNCLASLQKMVAEVLVPPKRIYP
jgi:hypothetical protein